jgi:nitrate reductase gamma subunit
MWDTFWFVAIPYMAFALAVVGSIARYRMDRFSYSSQSSQFLESRLLFWGSNAWHYGIILVLGAHIAALAFSGAWADLVANPTRLYTLEVIGLALSFAFSASCCSACAG